MNQITTRYVTENGACYEQYVIPMLRQRPSWSSPRSAAA